MKAWIETVLSLQSLDMKIRGLKTRLETVPLEKKRLIGELRAAEAKEAAVKNAQLTLEKELKQLAAEEEAMQDTIRKLLTQSSLIRKNNEYQVMLADIEAKKQIVSEMETKQLEMYDKIEAAKKKTEEAAKEFALTSKALRQEARELVEFEAESKKKLKETESLRTAHAEKMDTELLDIYNHLLASGKGEPLSKVVDGQFCSNCCMKLTQQVINSAIRGERVQCGSCSHLLYVPEQR